MMFLTTSNGHNHTTLTSNFAALIKSGVDFHPIAKPRPTPRPADTLDWLIAASVFIKPKSTERTCKLPMVPLSEITPQEIKYLWKPYIPIGKVTLVEGNPQAGKSWLMCALAAAVSTGKGLADMPDAEAANVLIFSVEDSFEDTLQPRLVKMGADLSRVIGCSSAVVFNDEGLADIAEAIAVYQPKLVFFDTLIGFMAGTDIHRANQVRVVMAQLSQMAARFECSIIGIRHLSKGTGSNATYRGQGSIDFFAAVRSVLLVGQDPDDKNSRALIHTKANLSELGESLGYTIDDAGLRWTGPTTLSAERILTGVSDEEAHQAKSDAVNFLRELLKDGPVSAKDVQDAAKDNGISSRTLARAKKSLGVQSFKKGFEDKAEWFWSLEDCQSPSNNAKGE